MQWIPAPFWRKLECIYCSLLCVCLSSYSCKWALYTLYIVSIIRSLSQNKVGSLCGDWSRSACQQTDRIIALYWSPVISGCVIRNSTEFPYLEEEERRPQGKLRLWQEFIIAIVPVYNNFVPAYTLTDGCLLRRQRPRWTSSKGYLPFYASVTLLFVF